jgi:starvation-inducible outer membrane lipoprotein
MVIKLKGKKMKIIFAGIMSLLIAGCVSNTPSLPEEYNGAIATIDDSFERQNRSKANIYYLKKI